MSKGPLWKGIVQMRFRGRRGVVREEEGKTDSVKKKNKKQNHFCFYFT